ncbi:hypothetical protein XpopCFBP1817_11150 [Xanthomonas populi]|uniref:Uncharacterized protein n=1 Tax=Xanthomonas populi TaxID=53414 RepID=A0A2S7ENP3_9XANT|nr:hypothetical protein XpopCFBP1817_11150 [Xanthomonas populi]
MAFGEAGVPFYKTRTEVATPEVADLLTFKAFRTSIELALGSPPQNKTLIRPGFLRHSRPSLRVAPFKLYRGQVAS